MACTFLMSDASQATNSCFASGRVGFGNDARRDSAADWLRPTMRMCALPLVYRAKACAVALPMPEVPPTNMAMGSL